jgi:hypothetical protein
MRRDNEASQNCSMIICMRKNQFSVGTTKYSHHRNAAEGAIRSFKDQLIDGLCSTYKSFPMYLWDRLLPQAVLKLNMLRASRINPKLSASTHTSMVNIIKTHRPWHHHEQESLHMKHQITGEHGRLMQDGWYIGPALENHKCYTVYITKPKVNALLKKV